MAVANTKSTTITNRDSVPLVLSDGRIIRSVIKGAVGSVAVGAADSINSYYPLVEIPTTAILREVLLTATAGMTSLTGNVGVFKNTANSAGVTTGVVANTSSNTFFASATALSSALNRSDVTNSAGTYTTDLRELPLWKAIGLTSDPGGTFDIGIQVTAANTGSAGRVGLEIQYVDNGS